MMNRNTLPMDFEPSEKDVVIGKGKKYFFHQGNAMLRNLAQSMLDEYSMATTKLDKSLIISDVSERIRQNGNFVKRDASGQWVLAEDLLCREKISAVFRDALHQRSRSNKVSTLKQAQQRRDQGQKQEQQGTFTTTTTELEWNKKYTPLPTHLTKAAELEWKNYSTPLSTTLLAQTELGWNHKTPPAQDMSFDWPLFGDESRTVLEAPALAAAAPAPALETQPPPNNKDIYSIFIFALENIDTEGNPFEPKPIFEGTRCG